METTLERIRPPSVGSTEEAIDPAPRKSASTIAPSHRVSQLESWLCSIQSRRRDLDQTDHVQSASS
jgi:hypothetical protein